MAKKKVDPRQERREATAKALADCETVTELVAAAASIKDLDQTVLADRIDQIVEADITAQVIAQQ